MKKKSVDLSKDKELGKSTISYDIDGKVIEAYFVPTMQIDLTGDFDLLDYPSQESDEVKIKDNAETLFAALFNEVSRIEMLDREKYKIVSKIDYCEKYPNGKIKRCEILFSLETIVKN